MRSDFSLIYFQTRSDPSKPCACKKTVKHAGRNANTSDGKYMLRIYLERNIVNLLYQLLGMVEARSVNVKNTYTYTMYSLVITYSKISIKRVRLPVLLVVC